ncbi:putative butyrate kinase 2 [bioreactor metagenome]|uniref:Putative butyrate kinase 2 n=1 Tax=bioreactor metagenome TaxID=1076179 RepID=A0A645AT47_9ZZZZ
MHILVINPGATSTKIAVYEEETEVYSASLPHAPEELSGFSRVVDQLPLREGLVRQALAKAGYTPASFDAVCSRGGLVRHIPSGTYAIDDQVIDDIYNPPFGEHASSLGPLIARSIANEAKIPAFLVDPVSVDELQPLARVSGLSGMERESFFHALNQKAVARKAALDLGKPYEALNLIVVHMGGGVSVAAHEKGRVVDVYNVKDEGSFSLDRAGGLPVNALVNLCYSGITKQDLKRKLSFEAGVFSYLGTHDFREVEKRMLEGDEKALLVYRAMAYQHAKDIGAMAAVLRFQVDAILLTGGIANSERFCAEIAGYVEKIAPIHRYPGEEEMRALALGALRVIRGEAAKSYSETIKNFN